MARKRQEPAQDKVLARLAPVPARRAIGTGLIAVLGAVPLAAAAAQGAGLPAMVLALMLAGLGLAAARAVWRATARGLVLTATELREEDGRLVARVEDVAEVRHGALSLRPAGGFGLVLRTRGAPAWAPGLWWRVGGRLGVGGTTPRGQARLMADHLAALLARRG